MGAQALKLQSRPLRCDGFIFFFSNNFNLRNHLRSQRFFDPEKTHSPEQDFGLCTGVDAIDFAVKLERSDKGLKLQKVS